MGIIATTLALWLVALNVTALGSSGRYDFESYYLAASALRLDPHANIYSNVVLIHVASVAEGWRIIPSPTPIHHCWRSYSCR